MTRPLSLGYSPCPNDTYIFYALVHNKVAVPGIAVRERLEDVETLNRLAMDGALDLTKVSYHAFGHLRSAYTLLRSGGALGRGCGPLIVARPGTSLEDLSFGTVAVPGTLTTAYLLLRIFAPRITDLVVMPFDRILQSVADGKVAAGLIIHESRFTYPLYGLASLADLGTWWEEHTQLPLPLGGILGKRSLGPDILRAVEQAIRESLRYARLHEAEVLAYCRRYSQEMDESVMRRHIDLYVNSFTEDLGTEGEAAVRRFLREGESAGIFPSSTDELFATTRGPAGPIML